MQNAAYILRTEWKINRDHPCTPYAVPTQCLACRTSCHTDSTPLHNPNSPSRFLESVLTVRWNSMRGCQHDGVHCRTPQRLRNCSSFESSARLFCCAVSTRLSLGCGEQMRSCQMSGVPRVPQYPFSNTFSNTLLYFWALLSPSAPSNLHSK